MTKKLLTESFPVRLELVESNGQGTPVARGQFGKADIPTANGRIYPRQLWEREFKKLVPKMRESEVYGELDHPGDGTTKLQRVSHLVTNIEIQDDGTIIGEAKVLPDTRNGKQLMAILNNGGKVGVSSRGFGSVQVDENGNDVVQDDFQLLTWDFVADPAAAGSFPKFTYEDKEKPKVKILTQEEEDMKIDKSKVKEESFQATEQDEKEPKKDEKEKDSEIKEQEEKDDDKKDDKKDKESDEEEPSNKMEALIAKIRKEESEKVVAKLNDMISEREESIRESIRSELASDPQIAGAKLAIEAVKKELRPYIIGEDISEEISQKEVQIEELQKNVTAQSAQLEEYADITKELGFKLQVEKRMNTDELSVDEKKSIRHEMGDITRFQSLGELNSRLDYVLGKVKEQRSRIQKTVQTNNAYVESLQTKIQNLEEAYAKALNVAKDFGVKAYVEKKLAGNPRAYEIKKIIERRQFKSTDEVDSLIEQFAKTKSKGMDMVRKIGNFHKRNVSKPLVEKQINDTMPKKGVSKEEIIPGFTMENLEQFSNLNFYAEDK